MEAGQNGILSRLVNQLKYNVYRTGGRDYHERKHPENPAGHEHPGGSLSPRGSGKHPYPAHRLCGEPAGRRAGRIENAR